MGAAGRAGYYADVILASLLHMRISYDAVISSCQTYNTCRQSLVTGMCQHTVCMRRIGKKNFRDPLPQKMLIGLSDITHATIYKRIMYSFDRAFQTMAMTSKDRLFQAKRASHVPQCTYAPSRIISSDDRTRIHLSLGSCYVERICRLAPCLSLRRRRVDIDGTSSQWHRRCAPQCI